MVSPKVLLTVSHVPLLVLPQLNPTRGNPVPRLRVPLLGSSAQRTQIPNGLHARQPMN